MGSRFWTEFGRGQSQICRCDSIWEAWVKPGERQGISPEFRSQFCSFTPDDSLNLLSFLSASVSPTPLQDEETICLAGGVGIEVHSRGQPQCPVWHPVIKCSWTTNASGEERKRQTSPGSHQLPRSEVRRIKGINEVWAAPGEPDRKRERVGRKVTAGSRHRGSNQGGDWPQLCDQDPSPGALQESSFNRKVRVKTEKQVGGPRREAEGSWPQGQNWLPAR